jgi:2-(3-amino-3-carboxypropyl)histidine synthase
MDFDIEKIIGIIRERNAKIVGLQFPEGLKRYGPEIAQEIEEKSCVRVLISGDPCYGACDLDLTMDADLLLHFGHSEIPELAAREVHYVEVRSDVDVIPAVKMALRSLKGKKIGLVTTVQHAHTLHQVCREIESRGFECFIGRGDSRVKYPGQVLGCDFSAARSIEVDEYLYIGSGNFHPLGVSLATGKRVVIADPYLNETRMTDSEIIIKQRYAAISKAMSAKTFCIIACTKPGQLRMKLAEKLKDIARSEGRRAYITTLNNVTASALYQFPADVYVNTGCPRIAIDDIGSFKVPMLTPIEFEMVLGKRNLENYEFDEFTCS